MFHSTLIMLGFSISTNLMTEEQSMRTMAWQLKIESLHPHCTAKGRKCSTYFIMAIAHQKGVVLYEQYEGEVNGDMFLDFIKRHFQQTISWCRIPKGKRFLQDECTVQNHRDLKQTWWEGVYNEILCILCQKILVHILKWSFLYFAEYFAWVIMLHNISQFVAWWIKLVFWHKLFIM